MRLLHFCLLLTVITGFNTSEDDPDPSQIPNPDSDSDLASPSQDGPTAATRPPDASGFRNASSLWTASTHQGGENSGSGDKTRLGFVPQESTHNGQEKSGALISDPVYTDTHSLTDSKLSFTEKLPDSRLSSSPTQWSGLSVSTLTSARHVHSDTDENRLQEKVPSTTKIHSDTHEDTDTDTAFGRSDGNESKKVHSDEITAVSSTPSLGKRTHINALRNKTSVTDVEKSESHGYQDVTDRRDLSMMTSSLSSSSSYTTGEGRDESHRSSQTFRTNPIPRPNRINQKNLDSIITDESNSLNDSVSDLRVTEFNSVTYVSDGSVRSSAYTDTSEMEAGQTNRLPRSTHMTDNMTNHTHVSLFTDTPIAAVSDRKIDPSTISNYHFIDASEHVTATNGKGAEFDTHTPYFYQSPNTGSSVTAQSSHTVHSEDTTVYQQTSGRQSHTETQYTPSEVLSTQTPSPSLSLSPSPSPSPSSSPSPSPSASPSPAGSVTLAGRDVTSTPASYSPNTLSDPTGPVLLSVITTRRDDPATASEATEPPAGTEVRMSNDDHMTEMSKMTSESNNLLHITSLGTESGPTVDMHQTSSSSGGDPRTHTNPDYTSPLRVNSVTTRTPPATTGQTSQLIMTTLGAETRTEIHLITSRNTHIIQRPDAATTAPQPAPPTTTAPQPAPTRAPPTTRAPTTPPTTTTTPTLPSSPTPLPPTRATTPPPPPPPPTTTTAPPPPTASTTQQVHTHTRPQTETHTTVPHVITPPSSPRPFTRRTDRDWSRKGQVFIMDDQPAVINVETFQVLLQVILEENAATPSGLVEVEPFLQQVAGYQSQHVTWHSGAVLQSVVTFRTAEAVSWLGRAESLLQEAGLKPLPKQGVFVSGVRVKNITVGGLHTDVCSWLFSCPSEFYCVSSEVNVSCRSVCHSEFCKNNGICVHRSGENPLCQCPVGEDFWFMGQRCDLRMTRHRLAGVCFGVLASIAVLMGLLAYLAVQRFKKTLIQAKAEQTQSSYRRFNHFDELSARFWRRSWPGSVDSLDNTAFSRSDELLHMRALDRACCYHDDTLSIASTYPESVTHLNTVYPHSSQYHWDMSTCSLADGVIDSGKASDLSVCSWPIEPIQWTPFPLLQQLKNADAIKPSRPRSYCEGMELVGLEKSRTA